MVDVVGNLNYPAKLKLMVMSRKFQLKNWSLRVEKGVLEKTILKKGAPLFRFYLDNVHVCSRNRYERSKLYRW